MLLIKIWSLPSGQPEINVARLHKAVIAKVTLLGLNRNNDAICLFPVDLMEHGLTSNIIIEVSEFFDLDQTEEIRQSLAEGLGSMVYGLYPLAKVTCYVRVFNPAGGFWTSMAPC